MNTGVAVRIESIESGRYFADELRPGQYDVEGEPQFHPWNSTDGRRSHAANTIGR